MGLARSVDEILDAISYEKGASIIHMLQSFLGADIFQVHNKLVGFYWLSILLCLF